MKNYIALFEYEDGKDGFSVLFPDIPGCFSAGDNYEDAYRMAHEALAFHLDGLKSNNMTIPEPRTLEKIKSEWDEWKEWENNFSFLVVPVAVFPASERSVRVNIMLPEGTLRRIDAVSKNRSAFLATAAQRFLDDEPYQHNSKKGTPA